MLKTRGELADLGVPDGELLPTIIELADCPVNEVSSDPHLRYSPNTVFFLELHLAAMTPVLQVRTSPVFVHDSVECRPFA